MGGDHLAIQIHIREKPLVSADQRGAAQGAVKVHFQHIARIAPIGNPAALR